MNRTIKMSKIYLFIYFSFPFPRLHSFSVVCVKKYLTIITLFVCHHLRVFFSKGSDLKVVILFFTIYFSSLNKVYTEIQSRTTLLLKCKHYCMLSKHYLSKYFFSLGKCLLENNQQLIINARHIRFWLCKMTSTNNIRTTQPITFHIAMKSKAKIIYLKINKNLSTTTFISLIVIVKALYIVFFFFVQLILEFFSLATVCFSIPFVILFLPYYIQPI